MSKFTVHNGIRSDDVNSDIWFDVPVHFTQGAFGEFGAVWFVSPTGLNTNGQSLVHAFTSIQAAVDVAAAGDTIYIKPGTYVENVVITTDYLKLVGIDQGYGRPDIQPAAGVAVNINAAGVVLKGLRCVAASGSASASCRVQGNGFKLVDCVFDGNGAGTFGLLFKGNADDDGKTSSEGVVRDCLLRGAAVALSLDTGDAPGNGVGGTHNVIDYCRFIDNTQDIVTADTGGGVYSVQDTLIDHCYFVDKNKTNYIDLTTSNGGADSDQTGSITDCYFATDSITDTNVAMVGTGFTLVGCFDTVGIEDGSDQDD